MKETDANLTPEQLQHWRDVLVRYFGPYALIMPDKDVQAFRDRMQANLNRLEKERTP